MVQTWVRQFRGLWEAIVYGAAVMTDDVSAWGAFTVRAHRAILEAQREAARRGSRFVEPPHLLLGMLHEPDTLAARTLQNLGVEIVSLRVTPEQPVTPRRPTEALPLLSRAGMTALNFAAKEARRLHCRYVGTEHLLLGLIQEAPLRRDETWSGRSLTLVRAREAVAGMADPPEGVWPPPPRPQGYDAADTVQA